jgi:hypothetical protein
MIYHYWMSGLGSGQMHNLTLFLLRGGHMSKNSQKGTSGKKSVVSIICQNTELTITFKLV